MSLSLRPCTPPSSLIMLKYALAPVVVSIPSAREGPSSAEHEPITTSFSVTPGTPCARAGKPLAESARHTTPKAATDRRSSLLIVLLRSILETPGNHVLMDVEWILNPQRQPVNGLRGESRETVRIRT